MERILETRQLSKSFGGLLAVFNLDMYLNRGEILGLIGPNGSGKTTCFNLINGLLPIRKGQVIFKGQDITGLGPHRIAQMGIGRTFQLSPTFDNIKVFENILVACHSSKKIRFWEDVFPTRATRRKQLSLTQKAMEILDLVGLSDVKDMLPVHLPYGTKKVLSFGASLSNDPEVLLLDEPLSGLNQDEIDNIKRLIYRLNNKGISILIIEHNMRAIMEICRRIIVLNYGKKIAEGTPEEIRRNPNVIESYLGFKRGIA